MKSRILSHVSSMLTFPVTAHASDEMSPP